MVNYVRAPLPKGVAFFMPVEGGAALVRQNPVRSGLVRRRERGAPK
jgi:hypothetical protein